MAKRKTRIPNFRALIALIVVFIGLITGVVLMSQARVFNPAGAWDCERYNFTVRSNGDVFVQNSSSRAEGATRVEVYINDQLVSTLNAPATAPNSPEILIGTVTVPANGVFRWRAIAQADRNCNDSGEYTAPPVACDYVEVKIP